MHPHFNFQCHFSLAVCRQHSVCILNFINLFADTVGVCKCNPPLVRLSRHRSPLPKAASADILSEFLPTSSACLRACLLRMTCFPPPHSPWQRRRQTTTLTTVGSGSASLSGTLSGQQVASLWSCSQCFNENKWEDNQEKKALGCGAVHWPQWKSREYFNVHNLSRDIVRGG